MRGELHVNPREEFKKTNSFVIFVDSDFEARSADVLSRRPFPNGACKKSTNRLSVTDFITNLARSSEWIHSPATERLKLIY